MRTRTAISDIQTMLMTPTATRMSINPMLEPTQQSPNSNPERTLSWQRRRKYRLSGVSSYRPAAIATTPAAKGPCGRYNAYTAMPTSVHTARYDPTNSGTASTRPLAAADLTTAETAPGSIMAAIIDTHRARKNANGPSSVATPMSIPFIRRIATTQQPAASTSVAVSVMYRSFAVSRPLVMMSRSLFVGSALIDTARCRIRRGHGTCVHHCHTSFLQVLTVRVYSGNAIGDRLPLLVPAAHELRYRLTA